MDHVWGGTVDDFVLAYQMDGATLTRLPPKKGTSGRAQAYSVQGHPEISEFQYHPGNGRHESGEYYKFVFKDGTEIRMIDSESGFSPGTITMCQQCFDKDGSRLKYINSAWQPW